MNSTIKYTFYSLILGLTMSFWACGDSGQKQVDKNGKEYTSAYVCPMHCAGSGSDKAGTCPACKMAYVANPDSKAAPAAKTTTGHEGHNHDGHDHGSHDGHDHGSHDGHDHGSTEDGHDHDSHEGHNH